ncbi:hypothetical protein BCL57_001534 [Agromyces flavus]|uniref:Zinc-finger n=1 Tax=Agromyces flavus TaxID=589382 RepID=A0A1H2A155_9MICO|nr:hypothetical protein [Agromyces flavus]MCP2367380.1 hypothetical protein [Agromyces flavus]GGI45842.1 hypothetical protein GCM10010932_11610 [Agromyces flavus]SDT39751.1 hypothetical protein SAMN04489721_3458 [Agromyces flavus]
MTEPTSLTPDAIERLTADTEPWLSCDDCFEQVDAAVEGLLGSSAPLAEPLRVHLNGCGACLEEARSLAALIADEQELTPTDAVARLDGELAR